MSNKVYRIFVEKKPEFAVEAKHLFEDIKTNLQINELTNLRLFNRYDCMGINDEEFQAASKTIFAEPPVDNIYLTLPQEENTKTFAIQFLPGQFDQRADSCSQSIQLLTQKDRPLTRSAKVYMLYGNITEEQLTEIKKYLINPIEAMEADMGEFDTLEEIFDKPETVAVVENFITLDKTGLQSLITDLGLAMDLADISFCQEYFQKEKSNPTITEIRMIDTYWSDHCRHTTFLTEIQDAIIAPSYIKESFEKYLNYKKSLGREEKPICLMDIATMGMRYLRENGKLPDLDQSEEINACSIKIKVNVNGQDEDWLLMFKNETHNHPTEIEPFGGAATCLGGAIRDPLSGRSYVYQAMRVTGAANPLTPMSDTLPGKLPQKKLVTTAAAGYSSYGNQIGLATGLVNEIYHPGYVAKRMEIGAVVGAAPTENVIRLRPAAGDLVILLGGSTGRDGCGGATGSSKSHTKESLTACGAEVQKGNPPEERKIQRLFRKSEVTKLIKRCNDFGAGGVSVAIGELADGLKINLDAVPKKYEGLDGTELAISESQERMAVVIAAKDKELFLEEAKKENLQAVEVAVVTEEPRLKMEWQGNTIVDIARSFLNSNGAPKHTTITIDQTNTENIFSQFKEKITGNTIKEKMISCLTDLNTCSQKGLIERFDSTIGAGTITMPFGGKTQLTPTPFMAAKIPVLKGNTNTSSIMSYGFNPYISEISPYHGAMLAVVDSVTKLVAAGLSYKKQWLTLQEYFERTNNDPKRWGKPFAALLGAFEAQDQLGIAAIGGKDSMSGTFENIDVPPTLVSFAIGAIDATRIITPEFKKANHKVYLIKPQYNDNNLPDFNSLKANYEKINKLIDDGQIVAAQALGIGGIAETIAKMSFGNKIGFRYENAENIFDQCYGAVIVETTSQIEGQLLGTTTAEPMIYIENEQILIEDLIKSWSATLEPVYPTKVPVKNNKPEIYSYETRSSMKPASSIAKPRVLLPVFPGTNCEYDSARQFERFGGICNTFVIGNLTQQMVEESVRELVKAINNSQIIMLPGGFSGGDEPEGSGKFIATFFRNPAIKEAVTELLEKRDGLMLGICNGFQALIKLGLLPNGKIEDMTPDSPTLTFNDIGRHQSMIVRTRIATINSPWLAYNNVGDIHSIAISHGEGKFVADEKHLAKLKQNGQIVTQYVDPDNNPTYEMPFNPNGSVNAIEGICSPDGRILGKMGHSERTGENIIKNIPGQKDQLLFKAGIDYFKM
jgi:phosphoribosylformylglycinamidine synthase